MKRSKWIALLLGLTLSLLPVVASQAQTIDSERAATPQRFLELHSGYSGGRFAHYTDDYAPKISLFGGGNSQTGQLVDHRFDGLLLGADFLHKTVRANGKRTITLLAGMDVLAAADRLRFADGHSATLPLIAAHPHIGAAIEGSKWLVRGQGGLLLGRVGYYASTTSEGFLSSRTVVDTVHVVPTFTLRGGFSNWILLDGGYGSGGLLGLANPVAHVGVGTGFGRRSPVAVLLGVTGAESTEREPPAGDYYFVQVEATPAASRWRASGFCTFGGDGYGRVAVQASYRLPLRAAHAQAAE
jgi:hypothetical protein